MCIVFPFLTNQINFLQDETEQANNRWLQNWNIGNIVWRTGLGIFFSHDWYYPQLISLHKMIQNCESLGTTESSLDYRLYSCCRHFGKARLGWHGAKVSGVACCRVLAYTVSALLKPPKTTVWIETISTLLWIVSWEENPVHLVGLCLKNVANTYTCGDGSPSLGISHSCCTCSGKKAKENGTKLDHGQVSTVIWYVFSVSFYIFQINVLNA